MRRSPTVEELATMIRMLHAHGTSARQMSRMFYVSRSTITALLRHSDRNQIRAALQALHSPKLLAHWHAMQRQMVQAQVTALQGAAPMATTPSTKSQKLPPLQRVSYQAWHQAASS